MMIKKERAYLKSKRKRRKFSLLVKILKFPTIMISKELKNMEYKKVKKSLKVKDLK